jgi:heme-degrading monooxygenase HmoA
MIARMWHGTTLVENSEGFLEYMKNTGVKTCIDADGNRAVFVLQRSGDAQVEFIFLSFWESYEFIRNFAGQNIEKPVYFPDDEKYLIVPEQEVKHYEVLFELFSPDSRKNNIST